MTPKKLFLYAKGKQIERKNRDSDMFLWFSNYAIPAVQYGIGAAFSKNSSIQYPQMPIYSDDKDKKETEERKIQLAILNEQKWAAQAQQRGLPPTIL